MDRSLGLAWSTALVGFVAAVPFWKFTKWTITTAHEGFHTAAAVVFQQKVDGITFVPGRGGATALPPKMPWLADLVITFVGYLGPSAVGLGGVWLLRHDRPESLLWISVALLAVILLKMRNPLSITVAIGTGFVLYWVARYWSDPAQLAFAYSWVWFLLMGSTRKITDLFWATHKGSATSDAAVLQRLTLLPDVLWLGVFWLATMSALVYGGVTMLHWQR
ncbi:M50 family metallopeptidase [Actinoplanes sp. NPDC004185]